MTVIEFDKERFVYDEMLLAYGTPKSTIKRLDGSVHDRLEAKGELMLRKKLFFKVAYENLHITIDALKTAKEVTKHSPRFIIVTDYETLLAYDTKTDDTLDTKLLNIINYKDEIIQLVWGILDKREKHSQKTLAGLYDPNKMPEGLKKAHHNLDMAIEQCYRPKPEERLEYLFKMYEEMTANEKK